MTPFSYHFDLQSLKTDGPNAALSYYKQFGCVVILNIFQPTEIDDILDFYQKLVEKRRTAWGGPYANLLMPHIRYPEILSFASQQNLLWCINTLLEQQADLLHTQISFKPPGDHGFSCHQDNYFNHAHPNDSIIAGWIALENTNEQNGGLYVYPQSHREELLPVKKDWKKLSARLPHLLFNSLSAHSKTLQRHTDNLGVIENFVCSKVPSRYKKWHLTIPSGAAGFMHGNLAHGSGPNVSKNRFRRTLLTNYLRRGAQFRKGLFAKRTLVTMPYGG